MSDSGIRDFVKRLEEQIVRGELRLALEQLVAYLGPERPAIRNEALLLLARETHLRHDARRGTATSDQLGALRTQVEHAALELLQELVEHTEPRFAPVASTPAIPSPGTALPGDLHLERIIGANNLKHICWLNRGLVVSRSVCRVLTASGLGTGFLVRPGLMMTCHHVIRSAEDAATGEVQFNYEEDLAHDIMRSHRYSLDPHVFHTNAELDYTIIGVHEAAGAPPLASWGTANPNPTAVPGVGEHVTIIQHPDGGPKQIAVTANEVVGSWDGRVHYTTDTMPGSSGAPVFNDAWEVVAVHRAGGDLQVNQRGDRMFVNEGVLVSRIKQDLGSVWESLLA